MLFRSSECANDIFHLRPPRVPDVFFSTPEPLTVSAWNERKRAGFVAVGAEGLWITEFLCAEQRDTIPLTGTTFLVSGAVGE